MQSQLLDAASVQEIGIELIDLGPGWIESAITLRPEHGQQDGYVDAGVIAMLADHSGGMAAGTLCPEGKKVLTIEYKINLLRPGTVFGVARRF
ncbi:MAG: PaaI family thioesterase [Candidatus Hydrogenedentota bacterium]